MENEKLGPFANPGIGEFQRLSGKCTGVILSGKIYTRIMAAIEKMTIFSVYQASMYLNIPRDRVRGAINALFNEGYLDKIQVGKAPPLYVVGPQGRRVLQIPDIEWDAATAFRAAAANHLCLTLKANSWNVKPNKGFSGYMQLQGHEFYLLSPRIGNLEHDRCLAIADLISEKEKLIIITVSKTAAQSIAKDLRRDISCRITCDTDLTTFYRPNGGSLVMEETFEEKKNFEKPLDWERDIC